MLRHFLIFSGMFIIILGIIACAGKKESKYPEISLSNDLFTVTIYLPDPEIGFYRSTRFDWSGMIKEVKYAGHSFYGEWLMPHDPLNFEQAVGPCESFGSPVPQWYAEVKPGETFIKIGVGHLEKFDDSEYAFYKPYKLVEPGKWTIEHGKDWIEFQQMLADERGWGYRYTKKITLAPDQPSLTIHHRLENTGTVKIETNVYNHNFTIIDNVHIGPPYKVTFAFDIAPRRDLQGVAQVSGNELTFLKPVDDPIFTEIDSLLGKVTDGDFSIENIETGVGFKVGGNRVPAKMNFWTAPRALCPEPFIDLNIEPGEGFDWDLEYAFFVNQK